MSKETRRNRLSWCGCALASSLLSSATMVAVAPVAAQQNDEVAIACNLTDPELRARKQEIERELVPLVRGVERAPQRLDVRLPRGEEAAATVARFMALEPECCPFAQYALRMGSEEEMTLTIEVPPRGREILDVWEQSLRGGG